MVKKKKYILSIVVLVVAFSIWTYIENTTIEVTNIEVSDLLIPKEFDGFVIVQISDLHNHNFGNDQQELVEKIYNANPDIIVITGDLIDSNHTDIDTAINLVKKVVNIAPIYYVTGNHEASSNEYQTLKKRLENLNVSILDDKLVNITKGESTISLIGIDDPDFTTRSNLFNEHEAIIEQKLSDLICDTSRYLVLLSHRPELINIYSKYAINLVLSGHAHGGQFRIPFIGGIIAPNQGLFPKYTAGKYIVGKTQMIVSRGLGNSIIPIRINNPLEIVVVKLKHID